MGEPAVWSQCDHPGHIHPRTTPMATGAGRTPGVDEPTRTDAHTKLHATQRSANQVAGLTMQTRNNLQALRANKVA